MLKHGRSVKYFIRAAVPERGGSVTSSLAPELVQRALASAPGWVLDDEGALYRRLTMPSAASAIGLIAAIGALAERHNHHPELAWVYRTVEIRLRTHDAGNAVSERDTALMAAIVALIEGGPVTAAAG
jgi:4a-hydroxytetrahydrobiopterin dehydratase